MDKKEVAVIIVIGAVAAGAALALAHAQPPSPGGNQQPGGTVTITVEGVRPW